MIQARIVSVMSDVFGVARESLGPDSSVETVTAWDSVHHMSLLLALEQEFGVVFPDRELPDLTSVKAIRAALERLGTPPCS
jgi:acyl carrier protein